MAFAFAYDNNSRVWFNEPVPGHLQTVLNSGVYRIVPATRFEPIHLVQLSRPTIPEKLYSEVRTRTERVLRRWDERRDCNTGALFVGTKGSGKTLQANHIIDTALNRGDVVFAISSAIGVEDLEYVLSKVNNRAILFFDEFEKVFANANDYSGELIDNSDIGSGAPSPQQRLLSLLDGKGNMNVLSLFTVNKQNRMSEYLIDRPGRIYYRWTYGGITEQDCREYCIDTLKNQQYVEAVVSTIASLPSATFDVMAALVEEVNRYNEPPQKAMSVLNITEQEMYSVFATIRVFAFGAELKLDYPNTWLYCDMANDESESHSVDIKVDRAVMAEFFTKHQGQELTPDVLTEINTKVAIETIEGNYLPPSHNMNELKSWSDMTNDASEDDYDRSNFKVFGLRFRGGAIHRVNSNTYILKDYLQNIGAVAVFTLNKRNNYRKM